MTMSEFKLLSRQEKVNTVYKTGVYVGKAIKNGLVAVLYQLDSFYVEIVYKKYRYTIYSIKSFSSTQGLDPYIEQISIEPLVYL
jgi:hypothetical protein